MKKLLAVWILTVLLGLSIGFFAGHRYTAKECAPDSIDFDFADKFTTLIDEELLSFHKSNSWGYSVVTTIGGPVIAISVRDVTVDGTIVTVTEKFKKNIKIRQEIIEKVLSPSEGGYYDEDLEKVRPLAKEIAGKIIEAQPNRK